MAKRRLASVVVPFSWMEGDLDEILMSTRREALFGAAALASAALPLASSSASAASSPDLESKALSKLDIDRSVPIPALEFDPSGQLAPKAAASSSLADFDYLVGRWVLRNKRLGCRLGGCTTWGPVFDSFVENEQLLGGAGNIDRYFDSRTGSPFYGVALRLFDPKSRLWSIYWADGSSGTLGDPLVGSFDGKVGHFFGPDTSNGRPVIVVFRWDVRDPSLPVWSQAFSIDKGLTWEWNTINVSQRIG